MSRRWLWVALGLSLALNILAGGYIAGVLWPHERRGAERLAKELDLNPAQRQAFERHVRTMREDNRRYRDETRPLLQQSWRELAKPQPDQAALDRLLDEGIAKRRALQQENARSMRDFLGTLEPEQRERFIELMRQRMERPKRRDRDEPPS
jgi:Spy/CpxP family protein refolding chaperone